MISPITQSQHRSLSLTKDAHHEPAAAPFFPASTETIQPHPNADVAPSGHGTYTGTLPMSPVDEHPLTGSRLSQDYAFPSIRRNSAISLPPPPPWSMFDQPKTERRPSLIRSDSREHYPDIASVPMLPEVTPEPFLRKHRSMSYSAGNDDMSYTNYIPHYLAPMHEEDDNDDSESLSNAEMDALMDTRYRTRSKSSAAVFDIWHPIGEDSLSWGAASRLGHPRRPSLVSTQTTSSPLNTSLSSFDPFGTTSSNQEQPGNSSRRFSLSPIPGHTVASTDKSTLAYLSQRRHSAAAQHSRGSVESLLGGLQSLQVSEQQQDDVLQHYPPEKMGKGVELEILPADAVFYVVEFKNGRSDMFFGPPGIQRNSLVIVEADRGYDLGKVTVDNLDRKQVTNIIQQQQQKQQQPETQDGNLNTNTPIFVKRILRQAYANEAAMLIIKGQDEAKSLLVCQSKVTQKQLPMQVVDAEYQWDRRKLTFYFKADRRVDFRELVRELFKLYKTRIWMCAVNIGQ